MTARRLSKEEFALATEGMTMKIEMRMAAYLYMVENETYSSVAAKSGLIDRSIQRKVRQIWEAHLASLPLPEGWESRTVALPSEEMKKVLAMSADLLKKHTRE